jgi:hypothetical protein
MACAETEHLGRLNCHQLGRSGCYFSLSQRAQMPSYCAGDGSIFI